MPYGLRWKDRNRMAAIGMTQTLSSQLSVSDHASEANSLTIPKLIVGVMHPLQALRTFFVDQEQEISPLDLPPLTEAGLSTIRKSQGGRDSSIQKGEEIFTSPGEQLIAGGSGLMPEIAMDERQLCRLIAKYIDDESPLDLDMRDEPVLKRTGTPVWAVVGYCLYACDGSREKAAQDYMLSPEEVLAALAYHRQHPEMDIQREGNVDGSAESLFG